MCFLNISQVNDILYGKDVIDGLENFMDNISAYIVLDNMSYNMSSYKQINNVRDEFMNHGERETLLPPFQIADELMRADTDKILPKCVFLFVEKAYKDAFYQIGMNEYGCKLGDLYYNARNGFVDYEKSVMYYKKTKKYLIRAELQLGKCYFYGKGVKQNYKKAFQYLTKVANQVNSVEARFLLAEMYYYGYYVKKDKPAARLIYKDLEENKTDDDIEYMGEVYLRLGEEALTDDESEYKEKAFLYFQNAEWLLYDQLKNDYDETRKNIIRARKGLKKARKVLEEKYDFIEK